MRSGPGEVIGRVNTSRARQSGANETRSAAELPRLFSIRRKSGETEFSTSRARLYDGPNAESILSPSKVSPWASGPSLRLLGGCAFSATSPRRDEVLLTAVTVGAAGVCRRDGFEMIESLSGSRRLRAVRCRQRARWRRTRQQRGSRRRWRARDMARGQARQASCDSAKLADACRRMRSPNRSGVSLSLGLRHHLVSAVESRRPTAPGAACWPTALAEPRGKVMTVGRSIRRSFARVSDHVRKSGGIGLGRSGGFDSRGMTCSRVARCERGWPASI